LGSQPEPFTGSGAEPERVSGQSFHGTIPSLQTDCLPWPRIIQNAVATTLAFDCHRADLLIAQFRRNEKGADCSEPHKSGIFLAWPNGKQADYPGVTLQQHLVDCRRDPRHIFKPATSSQDEQVRQAGHVQLPPQLGQKIFGVMSQSGSGREG
jgi:hypothetical protein